VTERQPLAWQDAKGFTWLETEPGSREVFCYDATAARLMSGKWRTQPLETAVADFGPMTPLVPGPEGEAARGAGTGGAP
jgi:hypothetical protein